MLAKPIIVFSMAAFVAAWLVYREATRTDGPPGVVSVGAPAPNFSIEDENGHKVRLSDYRGKVVFLNFWATWCAPCIDEAPEIEFVSNAFKGRKFQMLTISSDIHWDLVRTFQRDHNLTFQVLLDPGQRVSRYEYRTTGLPETFLIDANGAVVKHTFTAAWSSPPALALIEQLIDDAEQTP